MDDGITQVGSRRCRCKQLQIKVECQLEIIADVLNYLLLGCSCKTRYGDRFPASFFLLILADEFANVEIIDTEILSP